MPHLQASEANIFYEQLGAGPDIVWVGGGGTAGRDWQRFQTPFFEADFRNTTYDNRGIGQTTSERPMPWPMADFARDLAELIEAVCEPPVAVVGSSFGSAIIQELAIERPDLLRCAVVMGSGAHSTGWGWDFQEAEIEFRRAGGRLDGMMGVAHYAPMLYPAQVLGDRELWPKLRALMLEWMDSGENEESLIPQWDASLRFDQRDRLPGVTVPFHVVSFAQDIQAPPQDANELAALIPGAELHRLEGMGHGSWYGHAHDEINPFIRGLIERHLDPA